MNFLFFWDETRAFAENLFLGCTAEVCYVLLIDSRHRLMDYRKIEGGSQTFVDVSPDWVASYMYQKHAKGIILAHNHPVGKAEPSDFDISFTLAVANRIHTVGGELYDHIIVGEERTVSLARHPMRSTACLKEAFTEYYADSKGS